MAKATVAKKRKPKTTHELIRFVEDLKRQWMSTIDAMVDPLMIVEKSYTIRKANVAMAKMAGLDVKEVVGKKCYAVFAGRDKPCVGCKMHKAEAFNIDGVRDGKFYEVSSHPIKSEDGDLDGIVQVYRDRTEARRMQEQLSQQEKLASIGLLAGGVAHEINNPLGGILIFSQMLLREVPKDSPHYPDIVEIEAATQRCKAIVESLLDFARQNPADRKQKLEDVNVLEAVRTAVRFGKVSLQVGGHVDIQEEFDLTDAPDDKAKFHTIKGNRNRLIQLFLNLIQNALQAMPDGGTLIVRAKTKTIDGKLRGIYEVEDTGVGIPPEHLKRIFDPFFTTKDPGEGTGLGLALCYGIVSDLGGAMSVESAVNVGTRFFVELPLADRIVFRQRPAS